MGMREEVEVVDDVKPDPASIKALMEHPTARGGSASIVRSK